MKMKDFDVLMRRQTTAITHHTFFITRADDEHEPNRNEDEQGIRPHGVQKKISLDPSIRSCFPLRDTVLFGFASTIVEDEEPCQHHHSAY